MAYQIPRTVQSLLNIDNQVFNSLTRKELAQVVSKLSSAANKRIVRFQQAKESSPALRQVYNSGGKFSVKGKDLNQLRAEYVRVRNFMKSATGDLKSWRKQKKLIIERMRKDGVELTEGQFDKFWKLYETLKDIHPEVAEKNLRYEVYRELSRTLVANEGDMDKTLEQMSEKISEIYERQQEDMRDEKGVSGFFAL